MRQSQPLQFATEIDRKMFKENSDGDRIRNSIADALPKAALFTVST